MDWLPISTLTNSTRLAAWSVVLLCFGLSGVALAGPDDLSSNLSVSTVGAQFAYSRAIAESDSDVLAEQRLRWTVADGDNLDVRTFVDGRFTVDPDDPEVTWERNRVRQLAVSFGSKKLTLDVGRQLVYRGGPRLVDGATLLLHPSESLDVGAWFGLAPDLFTTRPQLRPGGGPVIAFNRPATQLSLAGEVLVFDGALDRAGLLAMARQSASRLVEVSGRLDLELAGALGGPHLSDGQALVLFTPSRTVRIDVLYDAFSTYKYLTSESFDPDVQRFSQRILQLGIDLGITQDELDPTINQLVGGGVRWKADTTGAAPRFALLGRYRHNINPTNRFGRVNPQIGVTQIPLGGGGLLDVQLDGNVIAVDAELQGDTGLTVFLEPDDEAVFGIDTSFRLLFVPDYAATGWYTDLFVDVATPAGFVVMAGVNVVNEPIEELPDLGVAGFLRLSQYIRGKRQPLSAAPVTARGAPTGPLGGPGLSRTTSSERPASGDGSRERAPVASR